MHGDICGRDNEASGLLGYGGAEAFRRQSIARPNGIWLTRGRELGLHANQSKILPFGRGACRRASPSTVHSPAPTGSFTAKRAHTNYERAKSSRAGGNLFDGTISPVAGTFTFNTTLCGGTVTFAERTYAYTSASSGAKLTFIYWTSGARLEIFNFVLDKA